eukprot:781816_1
MSFTMLRIPRNCINFRHLMLFGFVLMFAFGDFGEATTSINPVVDTYTAEHTKSAAPEITDSYGKNLYYDIEYSWTHYDLPPIPEHVHPSPQTDEANQSPVDDNHRGHKYSIIDFSDAMSKFPNSPLHQRNSDSVGAHYRGSLEAKSASQSISTSQTQSPSSPVVKYDQQNFFGVGDIPTFDFDLVRRLCFLNGRDRIQPYLKCYARFQKDFKDWNPEKIPEDLEYRMLFFLSVRPEVMAREIRNYYVNLINKHRSVNGVSEIYFDENENTRLDHILRSTECTTDVTDPLYFDYLSDPVIALDNIAQPFGMGVAIHNEPNKKYHWHVKFTDPISCKIKDE